MKKRVKNLRQYTSVLLVLALIVTSMPIANAVFADDKEVTKHDNAWDYTVFGNSITIPINILPCQEINITGDLHSNKGINVLGKEISIDGTAEASGDVVLGILGDEDQSGIEVDEVIKNVEHIELPNIYDSIAWKAKKDSTKTSLSEGETIDQVFGESVISSDAITYNSPSAKPSEGLDKKLGAFGAGFLTEMYENPQKWQSVIPAFKEGTSITSDGDGKKDLLELIDNSYFAGVSSSTPSGNWKNTDKIPADTFMQNLNGGYVSAYVDSLKNNHPLFSASSSGTVVTVNGEWDKSTVNPQSAANAEKLKITGGSATLSGTYENLTELKIESYGATQLIGNYPKLKYINMTSWANLNLAGNFPNLKGVYMPGGQLLLGTSGLGFNTNGADIINENGTITVYTAKDTAIKNSNVVTKAKIAIRGAGNTSTSKFMAEGSVFAADNGMTLGDMNDNNLTRFEEVPAFFSQSGISIVKCNFKMLQGAFTSRNGTMVLADSNIDTFRGFLYAQQGIDGNQKSAKEGVYVEGGAFNHSTGLSYENYQPSGQSLGSIKSFEYAKLPEKFSVISGAQTFAEKSVQIKDENGQYKAKYESGLSVDEENIIYIMSEGDITITADTFETPAGKKMIVASKNGNITIKANKLDFDGILYAPSGKVDFSVSDASVKGRIYADIVDLRCTKLNINSSEDDLNEKLLDIENEIIFILPPFTYYEPKDLYIYDKESAQLDYTIYTNKTIKSIFWTHSVVGENAGGGARSIDAKKLFSLGYCWFFEGLSIVKIRITFTDDTILEKEYNIYRLNSEKPDSDGDGLLDDYEFFYDTDKNNPDTDGDGILDGDEVYTLYTSPLKADTDDNGVNDGDEDFDNDELANHDELYIYYTDSWLKDTDEDGLDDLYEVTTMYEEYDAELGDKTDPNNPDTDGDGLSDYDEIYTYGTNPLKYDTDGDGIPDGLEIEYNFDPQNDDGDEDDCVIVEKEVTQEEQDENVTASVSMRIKKDKLSSITILNAQKYNSMWRTDMEGYLGAPYEFDCPQEFVSATLTFSYNPNILGSIEEVEPRIYYYDEDIKKLVLQPNQTIITNSDTGKVEVSINATHFSTYVLLSKRGFDRAESLNALMYEEGKYSDDEIAVMFLIDCSGSMSWNDPENLRKKLVKEIVNEMDEKSDGKIYSEVGVVLFDDVSLPISDEPACELTHIKEDIFDALESIGNYNGTNFTAGINMAVKELKKSKKPSKNIIMLTDGEDSAWDVPLGMVKEKLEDAIDNEITIHTIGLGSASAQTVLRNISKVTEGEYFYAATANELIDLKDQLKWANEGIFKDADGDGLPDYYELYGMFTNTGVWVTTDPKKDDTDGDGLLDGEEIVITRVNRDGIPFFEWWTDPNEKDSDGDGIDDKDDPDPLTMYDVVLKKDAKQITANQYQKLAATILNTYNNSLIEEIILLCYDLKKEDRTVNIEHSYYETVQYYSPNIDKLTGLYLQMRNITMATLVDACNAKINNAGNYVLKNVDKLIENESFYEMTERTQLVQLIIASDYKNVVKLNKNDFLNFSWKGNKTESFSVTFNTLLGPTHPESNVHTRKNITFAINQCKVGDSADEFNKLEKDFYLESLLGLTQEDIFSSIIDESVGKLVDYFADIAGVGPVKNIGDILLAPIKKSKEVSDYKKAKDIGKIGTVADAFNLAYVSSKVTDVNPSYLGVTFYDHYFSLYPFPNKSNNSVPNTLECIQNFNNNMLENPEFSDVKKELEFKKPLTLDNIIDNLDKTVTLFKDLTSRVRKLDDLTDEKYPR